MRNRNLPDKSVAGLVSPLGSDETVKGLALLDAAPFSILQSDTIIWPQPKLAKTLFRMQTGQLPQSTRDLEGKIIDSGAFLRANAIKNLSWDGAQYSVKYQVTGQDGSLIWVEEFGERIEGTPTQASHIKGVIKNITATYLRSERAVYLAQHDELTGLWNETRLTEGLEHAIALSKRARSEALFLRLYLSNIDQINEVYGYNVGDKLIKGVADRLQDMFRMPDLLARIGGVSFGICLYNVSADSLEPLIDRLKQVISDTPYPSPHGDLYVEIDVSSTELAVKAHSSFDAYSQTRLALKHKTIGAVTQYVPSMGQLKKKPTKQQTTEEDVLDALNDRRVSLAYQPIVETKTGELHHYECLLRLRTQDGEVISAGRFIMEAEKLGLIDLLDRRALELAGETLRQMPDVHLALNVSAGTVQDRGTADAYIAALRALGPAVNRVTLELTETVALEDPAMASRFSVETRSLGCQFAIDDFGAGYTSFRNLMAIEADTIKIDGSFIKNLARNPNNQTFVRMMVDLAQTFSVKTVAEMVENPADAALLKRLGVDYLQGYMFGIPSSSPAWRKQAS